MKQGDKGFYIFLGAVLTLAAAILFASCKKAPDPCQTCVTTKETTFMTVTLETEVTATKVYCSGEADTVKKGVVQTKIYTNGRVEQWTTECN